MGVCNATSLAFTPCVLQDYGQHAREFISSELGLRLLSTLSDPAAVVKAVGDEQRGQQILKILDQVVFKVNSL